MSTIVLCLAWCKFHSLVVNKLQRERERKRAERERERESLCFEPGQLLVIISGLKNSNPYLSYSAHSLTGHLTSTKIFYSTVKGSPSHGGDTVVYVFNISQPSLPTPYHTVLVSISVFMALSIVFYSLNSPGNCLLSHCSSGVSSALLVL